MTPTISLADRLRGCYSGAVYDVLRAKGYVRQTLPQYIRPLNLQHKLAGPVFTLQGKRDDSLDAHQSLLKWCELLSNAPANTASPAPTSNDGPPRQKLAAPTLCNRQ